MVSFNDRPIIHQIPLYRPSAYETLFWKPNDFAEFKRDAQMEKEQEEQQLQTENDNAPIEQPHNQRAGTVIETENQTNQVEAVAETSEAVPSSRGYTGIRGYNRPDWLPLQSRPGKIGYAIKIKAVWEVPQS